ncbi:hypothetical protein LTR56_027838, partial [Elasticomyces elasticus]
MAPNEQQAAWSQTILAALMLFMGIPSTIIAILELLSWVKDRRSKARRRADGTNAWNDEEAGMMRRASTRVSQSIAPDRSTTQDSSVDISLSEPEPPGQIM